MRRSTSLADERLCLDSWSLIAWLLGEEPSFSIVKGALAERRAVVSWINLGEVAYIVERRFSADDALDVVGQLTASANVELPTIAIVLRAAAIKAGNRVSYADAFAIATAESHGVALVTGDPEILDVPGLVRAVDVRRATGPS